MVIPKFRIVKSYGHPIRATLFGEVVLYRYTVAELKNLIRLIRDGLIWKVVERYQDHITLKVGKDKLKLTYPFAFTTVAEWDKVWRSYYLPNFSLTGKTVLDVGAGCGESAFFYLKHRAKKVICVEPDRRSVLFLHENAKSNNWNVDVIPRGFSIDMLNMDFDFMKMDCEGCEKELLELQRLSRPSVIETHTPSLATSLVKKFKMRLLLKLDQNTSLLSVG